MNSILCISIRFIQPIPLFHGRGDADVPEWPPSPMRMFQALLNAASLRARGRPLSPEVRQALQAMEVLRPHVIAPRATVSDVGYRTYVPHNQADLVTAAWHRGNLDASIAEYRMEKDFRPMRIETLGDDLPTVHYFYPLDATTLDADELLRAIRPSVRAVTHLGWGIDLVIGDATLIDRFSLQPSGEWWLPSARAGRRLRVHRNGSLDALTKRYDHFLNRLQDGWTPVPPFTDKDVDQVRYRRDTDPLPLPHAVFKLLDVNGDTFRYPHAKLIHIAGMVRHLAIEAMKKDPPRGVDDEWVDSYVAGHRKGTKTDLKTEDQCLNDADESREAFTGSERHRQLSYLPLPSVGHEHTDPGVRRVMIAAPVGDDAWLDHVARRLSGQQLEPVRGDEFPGDQPILVPLPRSGDGVTRCYTAESNVWCSFTPVILPGHGDHKPEKIRTLIERALMQAGIDQPCDFEWSAFSRFRKSYSAHKYDKDKRPQGYIRPGYLLSQTAVHLTLRFKDGLKFPGPLALGAGRHCGLGLLAAAKES